MNKKDIIAQKIKKIQFQKGGAYQPITNKDVSIINKATGMEFDPDFAKSYFQLEGQQETPQTVSANSAQNFLNPQTSKIVDVTGIDRHLDSEGNLVMSNNKRVWFNNRPEYYVGKTPPQAGVNYMDMTPEDYKNFQVSENYQNYSVGYNQNQSFPQMQAGGEFYNTFNPFFTTNPGYQNPFLPNQQIPNAAYNPDDNTPMVIDPNDMSQQGYKPDREMLERMMRNRQVNTQENNYDPNGNAIDTSGYEDYTRYNMLNPFTGGIGLEQSLAYSGMNFGEGNNVAGFMGAGLSALKGTRGFLSAYAAGKANKNLREDYRNKLYDTEPNYTYMKEGGKITNADLMTGQFLTDTPNPTIEIEHAEHVKNGETGQVQKAIGETHENGGIAVALPSGSKVLSDFTKVGAKNAADFKEMYDIKVKASDTFAKVLDKYNKKIGLEDVIEEEKSLIKKVDKQNTEDIEDATKDINLQFLADEIKELQIKKSGLEEAKSIAFEQIFEQQEKIPKLKDKAEIKQEGGYIESLAKKYNLPAEKIQQIMQEGGEANPPQPTPEQIIQAYAQSQGQDPQEIIGQLQQLPPEEQQAALQQMYQSLQGEQKMQFGGLIGAMKYGITPKVGETLEIPVEDITEQVPPTTVFTSPVITPSSFFTPSPYAQPNYGYQPYIEGVTTLSGNLVDLNGAKTRMQAQNESLPYIFPQTGVYADGQVNLANVGNFQKSYDEYVGATQAEIESNPFLSAEQKQKYSEIAKSQALGLSKSKGDYDKIYGEETSSRAPFFIPYATEEDRKKYGDKLRFVGDVLDEKGNIKPAFSELDTNTQKLLKEAYKRNGSKALNIGIGDVPKVVEAPVTPEMPNSENNNDKTQRDVVKNILPDFPVNFRLPPSAALTPYLQQVNLSRETPVKGSVENSLAANANALGMSSAQLAGLPPQQQAAVIANLLSTTQQNNNIAIAQQEGLDAQNATRTGQYNNSQADKEQILNEQLKKQYEREAFQTMNVAERDWRKYFDVLGQDQQSLYDKVERRNLLNSALDNFQVTSNGIDFVNGTKFQAPTADKALLEWYQKATPEQKNAYQKLFINK